MTLPLPDLCKPTRLALVLGVAELMVILLFLAPSHQGLNGTEFAYASFAALWVGLTVAVAVCLVNPLLPQWSVLSASILATFLAGCIGALSMWALFLLDRGMSTSFIPAHVSLERFTSGGGAMSALLMAVILRYLHVVSNWQQQVEAAGLAQAQALQARIRPHFLFNSLNTIAAMVRNQPEKAESAVLDLSDLFRAALGAGDKPSTLAGELALCRQYLALEQLRLSDRLFVSWALPSPIPIINLPRLVLQPLVENAILHGISQLPEGGVLSIAVEIIQETLVISIFNPMPPGRASLLHSQDSHAGHAIPNIRTRLAHMHGPRATLQAEPTPTGYLAKIVLPYPK